jgi:hypothetical protein
MEHVDHFVTVNGLMKGEKPNNFKLFHSKYVKWVVEHLGDLDCKPLSIGRFRKELEKIGYTCTPVREDRTEFCILLSKYWVSCLFTPRLNPMNRSLGAILRAAERRAESWIRKHGGRDSLGRRVKGQCNGRANR